MSDMNDPTVFDDPASSDVAETPSFDETTIETPSYEEPVTVEEPSYSDSFADTSSTPSYEQPEQLGEPDSAPEPVMDTTAPSPDTVAVDVEPALDPTVHADHVDSTSFESVDLSGEAAAQADSLSTSDPVAASATESSGAVASVSNAVAVDEVGAETDPGLMGDVPPTGSENDPVDLSTDDPVSTGTPAPHPGTLDTEVVEEDITLEDPSPYDIHQPSDPTVDADPSTVEDIVTLPSAEPLDEPLEIPEEDVVLRVAPGEERVAAAAVAGVLLDQTGDDDATRSAFVDALEMAAADGVITADEVQQAYMEAGFAEVPNQGTQKEMEAVVQCAETQPCVAITIIEGEGRGAFRMRPGSEDGTVELQSARTGNVYSTDTGNFTRRWQESGAQMFAPPLPAPVPPASPALTSEDLASTTAPEEDNTLRNVLLAGALLLPMAGGATYLITKKLT